MAFSVRAAAITAAALGCGSAVILLGGPILPVPADTAARDLLAARSVIVDILPGQQWWLLVANGAIAALLLTAAVGLAERAYRLDDAHTNLLALTVSLIGFAQVHAVFFPPIDLDYVSVGDAFLLGGYLVLLCGLVARMGQEITEHVSRQERLRLSRELHDGLAQHLSLLHLRLNLAISPSRAVEQRFRDLGSARRLVESAMLEARQAVLALRADRVTWEAFRHTLRAFAHEFAENHDIEVGVALDGAGPPVDTALQAEVLRILHEALSNAVRHGAATLVGVRIIAERGVLEICVADNGSGFEKDCGAEETGVGLPSIDERVGRLGGKLTLESTPGQGTSLRALLPLRGGR